MYYHVSNPLGFWKSAIWKQNDALVFCCCCCFLGGAGKQTQGLVFTMQVHYHWAKSPTPVLLFLNWNLFNQLGTFKFWNFNKINETFVWLIWQLQIFTSAVLVHGKLILYLPENFPNNTLILPFYVTNSKWTHFDQFKNWRDSENTIYF